MLTQDPQITPNTFLHTPQTSKPSSSSSPPTTTIFFITGNPGLIGYYHTFLSLLSSNLTSLSEFRKDSGSSFQVYGRSLAGFDIGDAQSGPSGGCHDLEEQICFMQRCLREIVKIGNNNGDGVKERPRVVLIGHSLGAYIAMEILRRHREKRKDNDNVDVDVDFDIVGGIMLFPTVVDIAKSPAGVRMTVSVVQHGIVVPGCWIRWNIRISTVHADGVLTPYNKQRLLSFIPHLALIASYLATALTLLVPDTLLWYLVKGFMNSPPDAVVDITVGFLKSRYGVRQAMYVFLHPFKPYTYKYMYHWSMITC